MTKIYAWNWMDSKASDEVIAEVGPDEELVLRQFKCVKVEVYVSTDELAAMEQPVTDRDIRDLVFERARECLWVGRPGLFIEVENTDHEELTVEAA